MPAHHKNYLSFLIFLAITFLLFVNPKKVSAKITHGPLFGNVASSSATIWARIDASASSVIAARVSTRSADLTQAKTGTIQSNVKRPVFSSSGPDSTWKANVGGLLPNTRYFVDIAIDGKSQIPAPYPHFKTFSTPGTAKNFKFIIMTDFFGNQNNSTFQKIANTETNNEFVYIGGDFWHINEASISAGTNYFSRERFMYKHMYSAHTASNSASFFVNDILKKNPIIHCYDDHDMGITNADKTYSHRTDALDVLKEYFPVYNNIGDVGCWQKFSSAQADFFILDTRSQRDPSNTNDDAQKSMLEGDKPATGSGQLTWLKANLKNSNAKWKIIFSGSPFNTTLQKADSWFAFKTEKNAIIDFIRSQNIRGVIFVSGDIHAGAIDDGSNSGVPEILVPSVNWNHCFKMSENSVKGIWSQGIYGTSQGNVGGIYNSPPCQGYGVVQILTNPDRIILTVKNQLGLPVLNYLLNYSSISPFPTLSATPVISVSPTPDPSTTPSAKPGDANNDNKVDGLDYVIWLNNYNKQTAGSANGDFNNNGKVDGIDYVIWLNNYNK